MIFDPSSMCTKNLEQKTCLGKHNHGVVGLHNLKIHEACCPHENPVWQAETADQIQNSRQLPFIPNQRLTRVIFNKTRGVPSAAVKNISPFLHLLALRIVKKPYRSTSKKPGDGEFHPWETKDDRLDAKLPI